MRGLIYFITFMSALLLSCSEPKQGNGLAHFLAVITLWLIFVFLIIIDPKARHK